MGPKNKSTNAMLPSRNLWDLLWLLLAKESLEQQMKFAVIGLNAIMTIQLMDHTLLTLTLLTLIPDHLMTIPLTNILPMDHTLLTHIPNHLNKLMDLTLLTLTQLLLQLSRILFAVMVFGVHVKTVMIMGCNETKNFRF